MFGQEPFQCLADQNRPELLKIVGFYTLINSIDVYVLSMYHVLCELLILKE